MHRMLTVKNNSLNDFLKCPLCKGYLIDAFAINECLHTFCKSCIIKYIKHKECCPLCKISINIERMRLFIRRDMNLQYIVYKLVPGLFKSEMKRRRNFYNKHPKAIKYLKKRRICDKETLGKITEDIFVFEKHADISLSLEYSETGLSEICESMRAKEMDPPNPKCYLLCPATMTIDILKKFLSYKNNNETSSKSSRNKKIEIMYDETPLGKDLTLLDVGFIYAWRRTTPMRLFYRLGSNPQKLEEPQQKAKHLQETKEEEEGLIEGESSCSQNKEEENIEKGLEESSEEVEEKHQRELIEGTKQDLTAQKEDFGFNEEKSQLQNNNDEKVVVENNQKSDENNGEDEKEGQTEGEKVKTKVSKINSKSTKKGNGVKGDLTDRESNRPAADSTPKPTNKSELIERHLDSSQILATDNKINMSSNGQNTKNTNSRIGHLGLNTSCCELNNNNLTITGMMKSITGNARVNAAAAAEGKASAEGSLEPITNSNTDNTLMSTSSFIIDYPTTKPYMKHDFNKNNKQHTPHSLISKLSSYEGESSLYEINEVASGSDKENHKENDEKGPILEQSNLKLDENKLAAKQEDDKKEFSSSVSSMSSHQQEDITTPLNTSNAPNPSYNSETAVNSNIKLKGGGGEHKKAKKKDPAAPPGSSAKGAIKVKKGKKDALTPYNQNNTNQSTFIDQNSSDSLTNLLANTGGDPNQPIKKQRQMKPKQIKGPKPQKGQISSSSVDPHFKSGIQIKQQPIEHPQLTQLQPGIFNNYNPPGHLTHKMYDQDSQMKLMMQQMAAAQHGYPQQIKLEPKQNYSNNSNPKTNPSNQSFQQQIQQQFSSSLLPSVQSLFSQNGDKPNSNNSANNSKLMTDQTDLLKKGKQEEGPNALSNSFQLTSMSLMNHFLSTQNQQQHQQSLSHHQKDTASPTWNHHQSLNPNSNTNSQAVAALQQHMTATQQQGFNQTQLFEFFQSKAAQQQQQQLQNIASNTNQTSNTLSAQQQQQAVQLFFNSQSTQHHLQNTASQFFLKGSNQYTDHPSPPQYVHPSNQNTSNNYSAEQLNSFNSFFPPPSYPNTIQTSSKESSNLLKNLQILNQNNKRDSIMNNNSTSNYNPATLQHFHQQQHAPPNFSSSSSTCSSICEGANSVQFDDGITLKVEPTGLGLSSSIISESCNLVDQLN